MNEAEAAAVRLMDPASFGDDPMDDVYLVAKSYLRLFRLCSELDAEMDGVECPSSAAAILNAIRSEIGD